MMGIHSQSVCFLQGSGLGGRVTEEDVLIAAGKVPAKPAAAVGKPSREAPVLPDGPKPLTGMQVRHRQMSM